MQLTSAHVVYRRVEAQVAGTDLATVQPEAGAPPDAVEIVPLNSSGRNVSNEVASSSGADGAAAPCFVLLDDAWRGTRDLASVFEGMQRPCFGLRLLQVLLFCILMMAKDSVSLLRSWTL